MTILLTGASGFVGLNIAENLLAQGQVVVGLAARPLPARAAAHLATLPGKLTMVEGDVRDIELVAGILKNHQVERVLHAAVVTSAAARERVAAREILDINLGGLATVAQAAGTHGVKRFLLVGSVAVFGNDTADGAILTEDGPHAPKTLYAISKSASEAIMARLGDLYDLDWRIGRLGTVFGPWEHDTGYRDTLSAVHRVTGLARAGKAALLPRPALKNWHYSRDVARSLVTLLMAEAPPHRIYNLGPQHVWSLEAWCAGLAKRHPAFRYSVGAGEGEPVELWSARDGGLLSWHRFTAELGPTATFDMAAALEDYEAFLDREQGFGV